MSFDYDKIQSKDEGGGHWWVAYSDLFLTLSLIFLLLYVTASLKSGTMGVQKNIEYQRLSKRTQELEEQIKVYNTLKDEQLQKNSNEQEQQVYHQLMDKLSLLKEEAKDEKEHLQQKAKENEQKEFALNQYQQIIRNIIDVNVLAKAQIKTREKLLVNKDKMINAKQAQIQDLNQEVSEREQVIAQDQQKIQGINQQMAKRIADLKQAQKKSKLSKDQMQKAIAKLKRESQEKIAAVEGHSSEIARKLASTQVQLQGAESEKSEAYASLAGAQKENQTLSSDLQKVKELAYARANLAKQIAENFKKAGVKADINAKTGEVTLAFGDDYFETGSTKLTGSMENTLKRSIPVYAKSLFEDKKLSKKISNVEIIGFASSTYKGRYVNPNSLKPKDQEAVNYNLKLSFGRANSIFKTIFNQGKMQYAYQKDLLPMVKVVGRGFLPEGANPKENMDGLTEEQFCKKFNCNKAQRVIIKFNLKD